MSDTLSNVSNETHGLFDIADGQKIDTQVAFDGRWRPISVRRDNKKLWLTLPFSAPLREECKRIFTNMTWHGFKDPPIKSWSIEYCPHNLFQLSFLLKMEPYKRYDNPLIEYQPKRDSYDHQVDMFRHILTRRECIIAGEMGLGKTLAAIMAIEEVKPKHVIWVAPKSALISVKLEYEKWGCNVPTTFLTYEGLIKYLSTPHEAPEFVVFDESQKIKNIKAKRTDAAVHLTNEMRIHYKAPYIVLMSGTPAPKSPLDWYAQCEIACPGFLKEGDIFKFKDRLGLTVQKESPAGGVYPELVTWYDDSNKCRKCGQLADHFEHQDYNIDYHLFEPSPNEVATLYKRMSGLVMVKTKKECTNLPEVIYERIYCKPEPATLRSMKLILKTAPSVIKGLILCRELSDGFQYVEEATGKINCPLCKGSCEYPQPAYIGPEKTTAFVETLGFSPGLDKYDPEDYIIDPSEFPQYFEMRPSVCPSCDGEGQIKNYTREVKKVRTAKDQALLDTIEEHEDIGRLVIYAGFTASIDRIADICIDHKWDVIRLDGRGLKSTLTGDIQSQIKHFQRGEGKVIFLGHPASASTGLTLTASPTELFYSNDFNGDARMQAIARIHRLGMDTNRGAKIKDLIHLPTDELVLNNLEKKVRLQDLSLGKIQAELKEGFDRYDYE